MIVALLRVVFGNGFMKLLIAFAIMYLAAHGYVGLPDVVKTFSSVGESKNTYEEIVTSANGYSHLIVAAFSVFTFVLSLVYRKQRDELRARQQSVDENPDGMIIAQTTRMSPPAADVLQKLADGMTGGAADARECELLREQVASLATECNELKGEVKTLNRQVLEASTVAGAGMGLAVRRRGNDDDEEPSDTETHLLRALTQRLPGLAVPAIASTPAPDPASRNGRLNFSR